MIAVARARLNTWAEMINARTLRERALMFVTLMVVLYVFAVAVVFAPLQREHDGLRRVWQERSAEIEALNTKVLQTLAQQGDEKLARAARLQALQAQLRELEKSGPKLHGQLVPPAEMNRLVTTLLRGNGKLRWLEMESLKPTVVDEPGASPGAGGGVIYKHGLRMRFSGEYREIVDFLRALEASPWTIFWGDAALEADQPPRSTVSVVIYTLSSQDIWIGGGK